MPNNNDLINLVNNKKPVELVQELKDEHKIPTFEEFMKTYESDGNLNYDDLNGGNIDEAKRYGPMPRLHRDADVFYADYSSRMNHWLYRAFFYENGTIEKVLCLTGIDEMKEALRKIENGTIKVVRNKSQYDELEFEKCETREREVKEALRKRINNLENDYSYHEESEVRTLSIEGRGQIYQR